MVLLSGAACSKLQPTVWASWVGVVFLLLHANSMTVLSMSSWQIEDLRRETKETFYHGYDNYLKYAYPEDELRPLSCAPLVRDNDNPEDFGINDVLGNYSLTLIDSLSTLAILASSPSAGSRNALYDFQNGIALLVEQYGDGTAGASGQGKRARGFDLDSKVQVFETVIRGLGGLLSAHQFAVGDLPIRGYSPVIIQKDGRNGIRWPNSFLYDNQLLRLAHDLGERLLPAFSTATGIPYPRVNLRTGVPFYANSPYKYNAEYGQCSASGHTNSETTRTCSAGSGSLVLEMVTLSRLTGDPRFEQVGKAAFWAIWNRRTSIGLVGSDISPETGDWLSGYTGIGAGVDSFFEYAFKAHIFLSDSSVNTLNKSDSSSSDFLLAWLSAHSGIKRHIYRGSSYEHPHYIQVDINTGAARAFSIDSLSAFFPGLLTLAGQLEEAIETHLLFTALWTRFSSLPERWSALSGSIEKGMGWWVGRPEFIESTWYLYRATQDPWYLHVGEMALRDIKRRCWTPCGWAGLRDVRTGEKGDRMESFFLGETIKYLFLLFDPKHPLNSLDAPFVFTTEAHPLIIPKAVNKHPTAAKARSSSSSSSSSSSTTQSHVKSKPGSTETCPIPPKPVPLTYSAMASRKDIFHAAVLARLKFNPPNDLLTSSLFDFTADHPSTSSAGLQSPSNYSYYPWTLPRYLIPPNGISSPMFSEATFDLSFPNLPNTPSGVRSLTRVQDGLLINSVGGLRFSMVKERLASDYIEEETFRVQTISNTALGRDEKVFIPHSRISTFDASDPYFTQIRDSTTVELLLEFNHEYRHSDNDNESEKKPNHIGIATPVAKDRMSLTELEDLMKRILKLSDEEFGQAMDIATELGIPSPINSTDLDPRVLEKAFAGLFNEPLADEEEEEDDDDEATNEQVVEDIDSNITNRSSFLAYFSTGPGSAAIPDSQIAYGNDEGGKDNNNHNNSYNNHNNRDISLPWTTIYLSDETCNDRLPASVPRHHQVIVMKRGGCTFSQKLQNIPAFAPSPNSLQMVVVVSYPERHTRSDSAASDRPRDGDDDDEYKETQFIRPLLEKMQVTPGGLTRAHPIPLIMVDGGDEGYELLRRAKSLGVKRRWHIFSQDLRISNVLIT